MLNLKLTRLFTMVLLIGALVLQSGQAKSANGTESVKPAEKTAGQAADLYNQPTNQIIVKYKTFAPTIALFGPAATFQVQRLSAAAGVPLTYLRVMSGSANVMRLAERMPLEQVQALADRLKALPEVEYAEPDTIKYHTILPPDTPNDPQYIDGNQWDFLAPTPGNFGINAKAAWDISTGSPSVVVGVIDTGITNHVDLAGQTFPPTAPSPAFAYGYDFVTDIPTANDGDGRDADPSDPGDWVAANDCTNGSPAENSSWHGTHTAGTIGAVGNNGLGVAGVSWNTKILPVRVLGKCGGSTSDVVDGMRWAAGLPVAGVPTNLHPAKVLSISLGGGGSCDITEQNAINEITAVGVSVVVAAGNSAIDAINFSPANCNGVITVAATGRSGSRAYYSNYGSTIEISAPGGDDQQVGDFGILSTVNSGKTVPVDDAPNGYYGYMEGTSMATPHVAGVVALMYSVHPSLTPRQVLRYLQQTVTPFPDASCNTNICGSGILNAGAAVAAVNQVVLPPDLFTYLPVISAPSKPFTGQVTDNGTPVGGVTLTMRYSTDGGYNYTTYTSTTTAANGTFSFNTTPDVSASNKSFYVFFGNTTGNKNWLNGFYCYEVTSTNGDYSCAINLHDIVMTSPNPGSTVGLPNTFRWNARSTTSDSYIWSIYNWDTKYWIGDSEKLGYTNGVTLNGLNPSTFSTSGKYGWKMDGYTPDGYASSYFMWLVKFANLGYMAAGDLAPVFSIGSQGEIYPGLKMGSGEKYHLPEPDLAPAKQLIAE